MNITQNSMRISSDMDLRKAIESVSTSPLSLSLDELYLDIDTEKYSADMIEKALQDTRLMGFTHQKRKQRGNIENIQMTRPAHSRDIELEREKLGYWGKSENAPRYSVCVCNYNMADTLERAMSSVANQLDPNLYEVVVVDDGSTDESLKVLKSLAQKYPNFRYISLPRDPKRKLGETRNLSIRAARGEYVLIHIDADDEWEPYLTDLVRLFHNMEDAVGYDFLLAGQQTGIGKRDLLLRYGPYDNLYRYEDRNMMMRLANKNLLLFLDYRVYRARMARPIKKKILKTYIDVWSQLTYEMRENTPKLPLVMRAITDPITNNPRMTMKVMLLRLLLILPVYIVTRFQSPIINPITWAELHAYHEEKRGTYSELMTRWGKNPDMSFLSPNSQAIYSHATKLEGFTSSK